MPFIITTQRHVTQHSSIHLSLQPQTNVAGTQTNILPIGHQIYFRFILIEIYYFDLNHKFKIQFQFYCLLFVAWSMSVKKSFALRIIWNLFLFVRLVWKRMNHLIIGFGYGNLTHFTPSNKNIAHPKFFSIKFIFPRKILEKIHTSGCATLISYFLIYIFKQNTYRVCDE